LTKKRQTSTQSTSIQDTPKENDGSFSSSSLNVPNTLTSTTQNSHQQIIKSQIPSVLKVTPASKSGKVTTFLKKESSMSKKKILRENVTTALVNQIPHKKIRVSNSSSSGNAISSNTDKEGGGSCYVNDAELPCCSRSFIYKPPSSPSSSSTSSAGQVKITSFLPIKKVGVKFSSPATPKASTLKKGRSLTEPTAVESTAPTFHSLSEKLLKKKKRLLKSETTLKRKKSRPQKPLV
jgi:hypothetical protein